MHKLFQEAKNLIPELIMEETDNSSAVFFGGVMLFKSISNGPNNHETQIGVFLSGLINGCNISKAKQ